MFNVPKLDRRLKNKDEVLTLVLEEEAVRPLAISADFLAENRVYHDRIGEVMEGGTVGEVVASNNAAFKSGEQSIPCREIGSGAG